MNTIHAGGEWRKLAVLPPRGRLDLPTARSTAGMTLPSRSIFSIEDKFGPIRDQGSEGSCVMFGVAQGGFEYEHFAGMADPQAAINASYYWAREIAGYPIDQDTGLSVQDGINAGMQKGFALATSWPYTLDDFAIKPPPQVEAEAARHKILFAAYCPTVDTIIASILQGFSVVNAMELTQNFQSIGPDGKYTPGGPDIGGHCQNFVAVDFDNKLLKNRNQWGIWGDTGGEWIPFSMVEDGTVRECVTIRWVEVQP